MLIYHFQVQELYGGKKYQQFDTHEVSRTLVDIWFQGVRLQGSQEQQQEVLAGRTGSG